VVLFEMVEVKAPSGFGITIWWCCGWMSVPPFSFSAIDGTPCPEGYMLVAVGLSLYSRLHTRQV